MIKFELAPISILMEFVKHKGFDFTDEEFHEYIDNMEYKTYWELPAMATEADVEQSCVTCRFINVPQFSLPCRVCSLRDD